MIVDPRARHRALRLAGVLDDEIRRDWFNPLQPRNPATGEWIPAGGKKSDWYHQGPGAGLTSPAQAIGVNLRPHHPTAEFEDMGDEELEYWSHKGGQVGVEALGALLKRKGLASSPRL